MTHNKEHLMDLARRCQAKRREKPKRRELTRDETLIRIGEIKSDLMVLYPELKEIKAAVKAVEKLYEQLCDEKYHLELSITKVTRVSLRAVKTAKTSRKDAMRRKLLDAFINASPEEPT